jgi:hypothetical protein
VPPLGLEHGCHLLHIDCPAEAAKFLVEAVEAVLLIGEINRAVGYHRIERAVAGLIEPLEVGVLHDDLVVVAGEIDVSFKDRPVLRQ